MALLTLRRAGRGSVPVAPGYPGSAAPGLLTGLPYGYFVGADGQAHAQFDLATTELSQPSQQLTWSAGARLGPVPVIHAHYLETFLLHVQLAGTINQIANEPSAPAIQPNGLGAIFANVRAVLSGQDNPVDVSGRWLPIREAVEAHAFVDTSTYSLPAKNTTANPVVGNWSIDAVLRVPIALSKKSKPGDWSPRGLIYVQDDTVSLNLFLLCGQLSDFISVATGDTINLTSGSVSVRQDGMTIPSDPMSAPDLSEIHTMTSTQYPAVQGTRTLVPLITGDVYTRLAFAVILPSGQVDSTNSAGLSAVTLKYGGNYRKEDSLSPEEMRFRNAADDSAAVAQGYYVFDWSRDWPRNVFDSSKVTDLRLQLDFTAAPAAGTLIEWFAEQLVASV
jgi:hypothetical protein